MGGGKGLSLMSGGLDSQLAIKVLERAGATVEAVQFTSPFFKDDGTSEKAAKALGVKLHQIDFTSEIVNLLKGPAHGFGGAMNPCIDCHGAMIRKAGELMVSLGYDFVATGEVAGQRPMSQNRQALGIVERTSGLTGRLIRPLSALLLEPTEVENLGLVDRSKLLDISGRGRERQIALAAEFGIVEYPSPAGGCRLTEEGYSKRLRDVMSNEGIDERWILETLTLGRRFRLACGALVILGRDKEENSILKTYADKGLIISPTPGVPGPNALVLSCESKEGEQMARSIVAAYSKGTTEADRVRFKSFQIL